MAKKKKTTTRRRRSPLSAGGHRRRRSPRRSHGLSSMLSHTSIMNSAKHSLMGAGGGILASEVAKRFPQTATGKVGRIMTGLAAGIILSSLGWNNMAAGFNGAMAASAFPTGLADAMLADDGGFADDNALADDSQVYLSENEEPYVLRADGSPRLLSETEIAELEAEGVFDQYHQMADEG